MDPISSKRDYEIALGLVHAAISEWDPYRLLAEGAPPDEFDSEIAQLVARYREIATPEDAAKAIFEVFSGAFGAKDFPIESCREVGIRMFERLDVLGYLPKVNEKRGPLDIGVADLRFHDSVIHRVVENPETDELGFEVMYPVDWEINRFEERTIVFRDFTAYSIAEGLLHGRPTILSVVQIGEKYRRARLRIETNAGDRLLLARGVEIRVGWNVV